MIQHSILARGHISRFWAKLRLACAGLIVTVLAACSGYTWPPDEDARTTSLLTNPIAVFNSLFGRAAPIPRPGTVFTPEVLADVPLTLLLLEFENNDGWSVFQPRMANGAVLSWYNDSNQVVAFDEEGFLQNTANLGRDLMAADTSALADYVGRGVGDPNNLVRVMETLDAQNAIVREAYVCALRDAGVAPRQLLHSVVRLREIQEECYGPGGKTFVNLYWRDPQTGFLRGSTQWISPDMGRARFEVITP